MESVLKTMTLSRKGLAQLSVVCGAFLFCFFPGISQLVVFWQDSYVYSYGFLIPLISLYLVWRNRGELEQIEVSPAYGLGSLLLVSSIALFILAQKASVFVVQSFAIIPAVAGTVLLLLGRRFLLALLFPIAYLLFMVPVWDFVTSRLQFPFQTFSASLASTLLYCAGVPVHRDSVFLQLPNITLEVAEVCSGVNNLTAVLALALPLSYVALRSWRRRVILVTGGIVIAALSNGLRVAIIALLSYYGISATLHGPGHFLQAMFVSFVGYIVLFVGAVLLSEKRGGGAPTSRTAPLSTGPVVALGAIRAKNSSVMLAAALFLAIGGYVNFYDPFPVPLKADFAFLPSGLGGLKGTDVLPDPKVAEAVGAEKVLSRAYEGDDGVAVRLYVGYMESQEQRRKVVNYRTAAFHKGAQKERIALGDARAVEVNRVVDGQKGYGRLTYFWYDVNGRIIASPYEAKLWTARDALLRNRTNGAIVMVTHDLTDARTAETVERRAKDFIAALIPALRTHLPQ